MKRITYLAPVSQLLSQNNTSMRLILPILVVLFSGYSLTLSAQATVVDFTNPTTATWTNPGNSSPAQVQIGGVMAMWAGDVNGNGIVSYDGTSFLNLSSFNNYPESAGNSDLLGAVFAFPSNSGNSRTATDRIYNMADMDLDGIVSYDGTGYLDLVTFINYPTTPGNSYLLSLIFNHPNNGGNSRTFTYQEQLPEHP